WLTNQIRDLSLWNNDKLFELYEIIQKHPDSYELITLKTKCKEEIDKINDEINDEMKITDNLESIMN
ncbi:hypothetical protein, partial [Aliivibrio sifiae]